MATKMASMKKREKWVPDYSTTNASFIKMASVLKRKGIKNYNFFLKLYDKSLMGVDPHDETLDAATKLRIVNECRRNFWYFLREVMVVPGTKTGKFELHRGNLAAAWALSKQIATYLVLPRQHGKTWLVIAYALWVFNFGSTWTNMTFMNKAFEDSKLNLRRLKQARDLLPEYLQMKHGVNANNELKEIRTSVTHAENALHNEINVKASARNPISADELGRGTTTAWFWIDEFAFLQFSKIIYSALAPAWSKAAENALEQNKPIARILTTTPGDLGLDHGMFAWEVRDNAAKFNERLYDEEDIADWMKHNSKNDYLYIEFQYWQLGHTDPDAWYAEQCKGMLFDYPKIRREILLQWSNGSTNSPFAEEDLSELSEMQLEPNDNQSITINKYYTLNVYRPLVNSERYIISVDPAKGRGDRADSTAIVVTNVKTNLVHAIFKSNTIQYKETYRFLYTLVYNYIPNSVLVVENNIDTLIEYIQNSPMKHMLYYETPKDSSKGTVGYSKKKPATSHSIIYGLNTNNRNRPKYFDILFQYVSEYKERIAVRELVDEIKLLEYKTPERIEAMSGKHDDIVLAYLLGQYVLWFGTNKSRFGLYFADGISKEQTKINNEVFRETEVFNNISDRTRELQNNEFFKRLLVPLESMEDIERKWAAKAKREAELELGMKSVYVPEVFAPSKEFSGMSQTNAGVFRELNDFNLSKEDQVGVHTWGFDDDDSTGGFF